MPKPNDQKKAKNSKLAFKFFLKSIRGYRFGIIISVALSIASSLFNLFVPRFLGDITTVAKNSYDEFGVVDWASVGRYAILTIIFFSLSALLIYIQGYILAVISNRYTESLRNQIIEKIGKLPISYFDKHQFGDTLSRITNDVDTIAITMSQEIADITLSFTTLIGVLAMMFIISVPLSFIAVISIPLSIFCVGKIAKKAQKFFKAQQTILGELNSEIEEDYSGYAVIRSNSYEKTAVEEFQKVNHRLAKTSWKAQFLSSLSMPITHIFTQLTYVAICIVGGKLVIDGIIQIGDIQAFIQYTNRFNRPITEIASTTSTIQTLLAACERVFEFLNEPEELPDQENSQTVTNIAGAVEFHNVNFSYDKTTPIIKDFSVSIKPGQQVAIVGPTGAGKTTIINLLMRFYDPDSGYITIDRVPTKEMKRSDVRKLFGMVLQDTWLFSGTIEDNLRYGKTDATNEEIRQAAEASDISHVIESLPKGYQTEINEDSDNISAGEKQLLTIARALIANPPMIILDEATSNVDTRTEELIQAAFEKLTKGRTSFVIAHRLSTIRNADLILVMKDGNIIEQGNHTELLKQNGFYAELYNSQFADQ